VASGTKTTTDPDARLATLVDAAPAAARLLARAVALEGGRAYLVGGGVRDHLLGTDSKDFDIEVFGLTMDDLGDVLREHGHVNAVGRSFGVWKWRPPGTSPGDELDVSVPRRDSKIGPGHRGISVQGDPTMTPAEAARRRDLTVNALMYDLLADQLVDPYDGLSDLREGVLRAVDADTFLEDPLRALRVAQFAARLQFRVDDDLLELCRAADLHELPAERIQAEWAKLLLRADAPAVGLRVARAANILGRVFPDVAHLQTDDTVDAAAALRDTLHPLGRRWALMLLAWLGPASTDQVEGVLDTLWLHTCQGYPLRSAVLAAHAHQHDPIATDTDLRRLSVDAEVQLVLSLAACRGNDVSEAMQAAERLDVLTEPPPPLLKGRHLKALGVAPGPHMGVLLKAVYEAQLRGECTTLDEARELARSLPTAEDPSPRPAD